MRIFGTWFDGVKWAEEQCKEFAAVDAAKAIRAAVASGRQNEFEQGAADYLHYRKTVLEVNDTVYMPHFDELPNGGGRAIVRLQITNEG